MLDLTYIFLHHWHRFRHTLIQVEDSLYLAGHNGSGKSTVLDAMQVILLADLDLIRFNSSAQERSARTLDGFVRGKIFETRWLRPGGCVGYIALEFTEQYTHKQVTLGCCIEAAEKLGHNGERAYFIIQSGLDPTLFKENGVDLTRSKLKVALQKRFGSKARYYDTIGEYQTDMLEVLGVNRRFFDLFQRALNFKAIRDIGNFVEQWLLPEHPLQLENLQKVVVRLGDLYREAKVVQDKLAALEKIVAKRNTYLRNKNLQAQYEILLALLEHADAQRKASELEQRAARLEEQLREGETRRTQLAAVLQGAKDAQQEKERQLYSLDVARTYKELSEKIQQKTQQADTIRDRKQRLLGELSKITRTLRSLVATPLLTEEELQRVQALLRLSETLSVERPLPEQFAQAVEDGMTAMNVALKRAEQRSFAIEQEVQEREQREALLKQEIAQLSRQGASVPYPQHVTFLRNQLESVIGRRPDILCEWLEIPDERWQNAVEAMLGERRFAIIVPPKEYKNVLKYIQQHRTEARLHDASVLNLERAYKERRSAQRDSLALQVQTNGSNAPYLKAYIDSILGNIITCTSAQELERFQRAITPELLYYSEWAVRVLSEARYQPWVVGQRAKSSQIEVRRREIQQIAPRLVQLQAQLEQARHEEQQLNMGRSFSRILHMLEEPLDDTLLRTEIAALTAERNALDLSIVDELQAEIKKLKEIVRAEEDALSKLGEEQGGRREALKLLKDDRGKAADTVRERQTKLDDVAGQYAEQVYEEAERMFRERSSEPDLVRVIANTAQATKSYSKQAENALEEHREAGLTYNVTYQFAGQPALPSDMRYVAEQERLSKTDLPDYLSNIEQTRQEAMQELREHVLHKLREQVIYAERELQRMNDALKPLSFHGDRYRFRWEMAEKKREYYHLIMDSQVIGVAPLLESEFYRTHQETFDRFYEDITRASLEGARAERADLIDYRTYMEYDIEVLHSDGSSSRVSRILGETSGGETQTPFYVAVAASFVQLYHMGINQGGKVQRERPTLRLAVFDEAFSKMDQDRIGATLDLFLAYGLQVITATPLERCEYLVPKMCTNLVLTAAGNEVLIEPYHNYAARLQEQLEAIYE